MDGMLYFIDELRQAILSHDPTALVSMGFLVPAYPNPAREGDARYTATAPLLSAAALDFFDLHAYIGGELTLDEYAENFGLQERIAAPLIMGKAGALAWAYRHGRRGCCRHAGLDRRLVRLRLRWLAVLGLRALPPTTGDASWGYANATWAFTDADGFLHAGHLAAQPAGCLPDHRAAGAQPGTRAGR